MAEPVTLLQATPGRVKVLREMEEHPYSVSDTVDYPASPMQTVIPPTEEAVGGGGGITPFYATIEKDQETELPYVHVTGGIVILNGMVQSVNAIDLTLPTKIGVIQGDYDWSVVLCATCSIDGQWTTPVIDFWKGYGFDGSSKTHTQSIAYIHGLVEKEEIIDGSTVQTIQWYVQHNYFPDVVERTGLNAISFYQEIKPQKACIAKIYLDPPGHNYSPIRRLGSLYPNGLGSPGVQGEIFIPNSWSYIASRTEEFYTIAHPQVVDAVIVEEQP